MFQGGCAQAALDLYVSLFPGAEVHDLVRREDGTVLKAHAAIADQVVRVFDSDIQHAFAFTPSFSFFVTCDDTAEFERLVAALGEGGQMLMEPAHYGFSERFAWLNDRFGVSWQFNLP